MPYYEFVLLYVDDALVLSENMEQVVWQEIGQYFELKEESISVPTLSLGGEVWKVQLENGVEAWAFSASQYVPAAAKNVEDYLDKHDDDKWKLAMKAGTPM